MLEKPIPLRDFKLPSSVTENGKDIKLNVNCYFPGLSSIKRGFFGQQIIVRWEMNHDSCVEQVFLNYPHDCDSWITEYISKLKRDLGIKESLQPVS